MFPCEMASELKDIVRNVDADSVGAAADIITGATRVFIAGTGRSLLVGKMFAVRLLQMGKKVFVVGDPLAPSIKSGDTLVAISGSGRTHFTVYAARKAREKGARVLVLTSNTESPLYEISDLCLVIRAKTKDEAGGSFLLGSAFELSALLVLESVVTCVMRKMGVTEEDMKEEHANIE